MFVLTDIIHRGNKAIKSMIAQSSKSIYISFTLISFKGKVNRLRIFPRSCIFRELYQTYMSKELFPFFHFKQVIFSNKLWRLALLLKIHRFYQNIGDNYCITRTYLKTTFRRRKKTHEIFNSNKKLKEIWRKSLEWSLKLVNVERFYACYFNNFKFHRKARI